MFNLMAKSRRFLVGEDGPTTVEYAVLLATVVLIAFAAISNLGTLIVSMFHSANNSFSASS
jgi:pilus assembly protein Flp/PilA